MSKPKEFGENSGSTPEIRNFQVTILSLGETVARKLKARRALRRKVERTAQKPEDSNK